MKEPYRNRFRQVERDGAVRVVRSLVLPAPNRGFALRLANHLCFAASSLATARHAGPADVVLAETPPLFTAAVGVAYARIAGARLVLNVSDRWPASAVELGALRGRRAIALAEGLERWCYRHATAVAVPTDGLRAALAAEPAVGDKVVRLGPAVDTDRFAAAPPRPADGPLRLLYAGTLGMAQNVATLVEAARRLGPDVVEVTIAGDGADGPALREDVAANPAPNVRMLGIVPAERVPSLLAEHDAAVVLLRDRPIFAGALPTKLFEAMARSRPVILGARGEAAAMVERYGAGVVVPPEDVEALARTMAELAADRGRLESLAEGALRCAEDHSWTRVGAAWAELLQAVARDGP